MECISPLVKSGRIVRCGGCPECINYKAWIWTKRIQLETQDAKTWFMTLTYKGAEKDGYKDVQLMLKRLRKGNKKKKQKPLTFRFMCVAELQKRGVVHYHLAVHGELTRRQVEAEWHYGFSNAKLMRDLDIAKYISKYLTKDNRKGKNYRASIHYGQLKENVTENDTVKKVFEYFPNARIIRKDNVKIPYKYQYPL